MRLRSYFLFAASACLLSSAASAQTISGRMVDIEGAAIQGIIVAYNLAGTTRQDTTDATGSYLLNFSSTAVPEEDIPARITTWGKLKAGFRSGLGKAASMRESVVNPDTLCFDGLTATAEPHYWSIRHAFVATGGDDVVDAATVPFVVTIEHFWRNYGEPDQGPINVTVLPHELRDVWDIRPDGAIAPYDGFVGWHPNDLPVQTGNAVSGGLPDYLYAAACQVMTDWEAITGLDFFELLPYGQPPTAPKRLMCKYGSPHTLIYDTDSDGFLNWGNVFVSTANYAFVTHEFGFRALNGNIGCSVEGWDSVFNNTPSGTDPRDPAYVRITYRIQRLVVDGNCYVNPYPEYRATP